jgi:hypothetical protein
MFVKVSWLLLQCRALICCLDLKRMLWLIWWLIIDDGYRIQYMITDDYWWLLMITVLMIDYWWLWWFIIYLTSPYEIQKEIRTCSRASTFWLRFSWRSKLWSLTPVYRSPLAWMYLMDSRIASLYPAMMVSGFEQWESILVKWLGIYGNVVGIYGNHRGKRTVYESTELLKCHLLRHGWNMLKCWLGSVPLDGCCSSQAHWLVSTSGNVSSVDCDADNHWLSKGPCNSAAMITTEVVPSPTSVSFTPNGTKQR